MLLWKCCSFVVWLFSASKDRKWNWMAELFILKCKNSRCWGAWGFVVKLLRGKLGVMRSETEIYQWSEQTQVEYKQWTQLKKRLSVSWDRTVHLTHCGGCWGKAFLAPSHKPPIYVLNFEDNSSFNILESTTLSRFWESSELLPQDFCTF